MTRFGLWRPSVTFWRVWTLLLVVLPQTLATRFPDLTYSDIAPVPGDGTVIGVAYLPSPPLPEQWLEYVTESGLVVLLPAIAFVLPEKYARTGTLWAAAILAALGMVDGYLGKAALESDTGGSSSLLFMSLFYVPAAVTLVLSERGRLSRRDSPPPPRAGESAR
ncbi:hypothetical protein [Nocardia wallacei]|uniref:hypothetical protein n=1 Tax=Nocardia TaxID=1817 RepID=UPI002454D1CF|nr:hypothetical protein [Nocardia wallacei]